MAARDPLYLHAESTPEKIALIEDRPGSDVVRRTWAEFAGEVSRLAHVLRERGVGPGDKVAWCGMNSIGVVRILHAARVLGATAVPVNYRFAPEEAAYVVDHCDAAAAYVDAELAPLFAKIRGATPGLRHVLVFDGPPAAGQEQAEALEDAAPDTPPELPPAEEAPAMMIYTSGTTGRPKGAVRRGLGDPAQVRQMLELIGYRPDDVYLTTGPLYHSGPLGFMQVAQTFGNTSVLQRKFDPEDWLRLLETHRVTHTFSAPTPIRLICNLPPEVKQRYDRSRLRITIANAAPWSYALKEAYLADFPEDSLWEVYGSTELGVNTILAPADQRRKPGSCGKPAPGVEVVLLDEDGKPVTEPNVPGELYVRSKTVFDTYYKAHEKYEEDMRGDHHTVGDMAYFDEEGFYFICDRKKDMIISGGMNVYPAEIEAALEKHPKVMDAAVFGIPSEDWGESVHAMVVVRPGETLSEEDVTAFAREHLASYKLPRSVSFAEEIPRTGSGKILKRVLREPFWRDHASKVL
jgi:fatty-acyl-CoA synthase/long-chain acyl-CoA synthetase